jgi:hypothetical protein
MFLLGTEILFCGIGRMQTPPTLPTFDFQRVASGTLSGILCKLPWSIIGCAILRTNFHEMNPAGAAISFFSSGSMPTLPTVAAFDFQVVSLVEFVLFDDMREEGYMKSKPGQSKKIMFMYIDGDSDGDEKPVMLKELSHSTHKKQIRNNVRTSKPIYLKNGNCDSDSKHRKTSTLTTKFLVRHFALPNCSKSTCPQI